MSKPIIFCLRGEHPAIPAMLRRRFESSHWDRSKLGHPMGWFDTHGFFWRLMYCMIQELDGIGNETKDFGDSPIHPNWLLKILPQNQFCVSMGNLPCFSCLACHDQPDTTIPVGQLAVSIHKHQNLYGSKWVNLQKGDTLQKVCQLNKKIMIN